MLPWSAADPDSNAFAWSEEEHATVVTLIAPMVPPVGVDRRAQSRFVAEVTRLLVARYGRWACGWHWSYGEGGGGGVVTSWCCDADSVGEAVPTAAAVVASLLEWRDWLEELADRFKQLAPPDDLDTSAPDADPRTVAADRSWHVERAATRLVTVVMDRTGAECAWYTLCRTVLTWFLSSTGMTAEQADAAVERAIGGRFESWTTPAPTVVTTVGEDLATDLTGEPSYRDR
ncbi:hypothetical protein GUY60_35750 [Streptomyces sp. YC537]|uniref:Uncharacterized protein n=1 Tax=Streptomyces boluensis TaxID=1775135 RepID=A0A964UWF8_9ACTN|nr:hypothetical protein [Streptomyces boluensis]